VQINFKVSHMTELSVTICCFNNIGVRSEDNTVIHEKTHTVLFASNEYANPYSRGTSPQTVPNSSTKGTRPMWPNFPTNSPVHAHWFLGSRSQTNLTILKKDHNTEQIKTRIHTCAHTPKHKTKLKQTKGPHTICHARPDKYYIFGVRTVPQISL